MRKYLFMTLVVLFLWILPLSAPAGDFDGTKPLLCAVIKVMECVEDEGCDKIVPESVGLPRFVVIDCNEKIIHPAHVTRVGKATSIERMEQVDGKLILQGAEDGLEGVRDGLGWTIAISEETGSLILTASGEDVAFIVYGVCTTQR